MNQKTTRRSIPTRCKACGHVAPADAFLSSRPVEGHPQITELGTKCPECGDWTHMSLDSAPLRRYRTVANQKRAAYKRKPTRGTYNQYQRALKYYQEKRRRFHEEWRPKLGLVAPTDVVVLSTEVGAEEAMNGEAG